MSVIGIGVDIVSIDRLRTMHRRYGERLSGRILGPAERTELADRKGDVGPFLAKRFAAKEALSKAFGTGIQRGVRLVDIEVVHGELGRPGIRLSAGSLDVARALGVRDIHLSLADERDYAIAQVVLVG
jgi:holo-[acyl-carrier protein] synthase